MLPNTRQGASSGYGNFRFAGIQFSDQIWRWKPEMDSSRHVVLSEPCGRAGYGYRVDNLGIPGELGTADCYTVTTIRPRLTGCSASS
jgi:hypothetical protein